MDDDWKEWDGVGTVASTHVPQFLLDEWETVEEYEQQTNALVAKHWNQFRAILTNEKENSEAQGDGYTALCRLQKRLDSRHEKIQEQLENWEFESSLRKLIIVGFRQKVRELALERATDDEGSDPTDEEFKAAWEHVLDRPMGETWPPDELDFPLPMSGDGWEVNPVVMRAASEEPRPPTISDLTIQYIPEDAALESEGIDPDSVSRFEIRSFDGDTTWNEALERLGRRFDRYEKQRKRHDRTLKFIEFRRRLLKNVLHQFEAYGSVEEMTEKRAGEIAHERRRDDSERMMDWEINAAQLYAYVQEHGQPSSMVELREETKVSPRQAWDRLKEQGYGIGEGVPGLVSALAEWAPEFEEEYGKDAARKAARMGYFKWPDQHEA